MVTIKKKGKENVKLLKQVQSKPKKKKKDQKKNCERSLQHTLKRKHS